VIEMIPVSDFTRNVRFELMYGYQAKKEIDKYGIVYLPFGCLEMHGSQLPMGLDVIKAHEMCCVLAQSIGGVVFPPHYYSGIHKLPEDRRGWLAEHWGNIYQEETAKRSILDIIGQIKRMKVKVCVLYTGHYPQEQLDMVHEIVSETNAPDDDFHVIYCPEMECCDGGDHAGIVETSLLLYLRRDLVNMSAINEQGYIDHRWAEPKDPKDSSAALGEDYANRIVAFMKDALSKIK